MLTCIHANFAHQSKVQKFPNFTWNASLSSNLRVDFFVFKKIVCLTKVWKLNRLRVWFKVAVKQRKRWLIRAADRVSVRELRRMLDHSPAAGADR